MGTIGSPSFLLIGPYDPHGGEYTFLAPPLGVWRLAGVLNAAGIRADVFDPNCCEGDPAQGLEQCLREGQWDVVGVSTTGMTLRYDLALAHLARKVQPEAVIVAGGMEATFKPDLMFRLAPFNHVVLGEGEKPLLELGRRLVNGEKLDDIPGTAVKSALGTINRYPQKSLNKEELADAISKTPYEKMPYQRYWDRLERAYQVGALPTKADREARLAEIRSARLITLNYCPMGCTFCSSTNFLNVAQGGGVAGIARLEAEECMTMIRRIVAAHPGVRTIIFQDDIFVFTQDRRILPLCEMIVDAKVRGEIPRTLQFISTNRIDAMNRERLEAMRRAGFRVLGFGIENFSLGVLNEFRKAHIHEYIDPMLQQAVDLGITPFLDIILTSPRCSLHDLAETIRKGYQWLLAGCEMGMYPYVIPFSGAAMANDSSLEPHTIYTRNRIAGTSMEWQQPTKILPVDPVVRTAILEIEQEFNSWMEYLETRVAHLPSRVRSLVWVLCAEPILARHGESAPDCEEVFEQLMLRLPKMDKEANQQLRAFAGLEALTACYA